MKFSKDAPVAELFLLMISSINQKKNKPKQIKNLPTAWLRLQIVPPDEKKKLKQADFFSLYTQEAGCAAVKEIRRENLAHFLFCKAIMLVQIQRD